MQLGIKENQNPFDLFLKEVNFRVDDAIKNVLKNKVRGGWEEN